MLWGHEPGYRHVKSLSVSEWAEPGSESSRHGPDRSRDDSNLKRSYANVCNVSTKREEVVMVFGSNNAWERGQNEVRVQLTARSILVFLPRNGSPPLLTNVLADYEKRFGPWNDPAGFGA